MKRHLDPIRSPDDFELAVATRVLLAQLPQATAPADFIENVESTIHKNGFRWLYVGIAIVISCLATWWILQNQSVKVVFVPDVRSTPVDLYNIPPVPATEYSAPAPVPSVKKRSRRPRVIAGE